MSTLLMGGLIRRLHQEAFARSGASDADLLEAFLQRQDPWAFELLLQRHASMVWGVCLRVLRNTADAEDAFQATFLVLVARASSVRRRDALGTWLYAVAYRTALKARQANRRRPIEEQRAAHLAQSRQREMHTLALVGDLDRALASLPEHYRAVVLCCDLDGQSIHETARLLGCPPGTVASRLARGRQLLARRLGRHAEPMPTPVCAPPGLAPATVAAAVAFSSGTVGPASLVPARALALTREVVWSMTLHRSKTIAAVVLALVLLVAAGALLAHAATHRAPPTGQKKANKAPAGKALDELWADLASTDEARSARAILALGATPRQAVPFLRDRLQPVKVDARKVATWIKQLDSESFRDRESAHRELEYLGKYVKADLEKAITDKSTAELKQRVKRLLKHIGEDAPTPAAAQQLQGGDVSVSNINGKIEIKINGKVLDLSPQVIQKRSPQPAWQRAVRAVAVLEHIGTAEATRVIEVMAGGEAEALPTRAAAEALKRLKK
jgi:RNA polymerase sigma factor (sigma-70 family)